jgi:hypothetical protein
MEELKTTPVEYNEVVDDRDYFQKTIQQRTDEYTNIDDFETYYKKQMAAIDHDKPGLEDPAHMDKE